MSKKERREKETASDEAVGETIRTSDKLGAVPSRLPREGTETGADIGEVMLGAEAAGQYSESAIRRQRLEDAKIRLAKTARWLLAAVAGIVVALWLYQLNSVAKPIERISADVRHLASEDEKLIKKTDALGEKLDGIAAPIAKIAADIEHLSKEEDRLNKKTEELEERMDDIEKPMERIRSDIEELGREDFKLRVDMEGLRKEVKKGREAD